VRVVSERRREIATVALIVILAFATRLWFGMRMQLDGDEATTAIMALHAAQGHPYLMEANFHYLGGIESWLIAPFTVLFGNTLLAVRTTTALFGTGYTVTMYFVGRRLFGGHRGGLVLGVVASFFPVFTFAWDLKARSYGLTLLITSLCLLMTLRIAWPAGGAVRTRDWVILGMLAGLGMWNDILIAAPLVVMAVALLMRSQTMGDRSFVRGATAATVAGVVGFSPWIAYNIMHPLRSLHGLPDVHVPVPDAMRGFLHTELPIFSGGWGTVHHVVVPARVADAAFGVLLLAVLWIRRRPIMTLIGDVLSFRFASLQPIEMSLAILPVILAFVLLGRSNGSFAEPRYLVPAAIPCAIAATVVLTRPWPRNGVAIAAAIGVAIVGVMVLSGPTVDSTRITTPGSAIPTDLSPLVAMLEQHADRPIVANYWLARPLMYDSDDRLRIAEYDGGVAFPDIQSAADTSSDPSWLFFIDDPDRQRLMAWCTTHAIRYSTTTAGRAKLYTDFSHPVRIWNLGLPVAS